MGYDIYIGEAEIDKPDDPNDYPHIRVHVHGKACDNAPSFPGDQMTGNGNSRHPSYSAWAEFTRRHGLHDMFFDEESGIMSRHPGCAMLTREHHEQINAARDKHMAECKAAGKVPGWDPNLTGIASFTGEGADPKYDGDLARLIWLEWWVMYALQNCKIPAIYNS